MPTPTDIRSQIVSDVAVKKSLMQRGDDERAVHIIDHQMLAPTEAALSAVVELAKVFAYQPTAIRPLKCSDGDARFSCDLVFKSPTILALLARQSVLMGALAEAYGCTYNGWGTTVVPAVTPAGRPTAERDGVITE